MEMEIRTKHGVCVIHTETGITESQAMNALTLYAQAVNENERKEKDGNAA